MADNSSNQPDQPKQGYEGDLETTLPYLPLNDKTTEHYIPKSSWIASISYDSSTFRLQITTHAGASWQKVMVYPQQFTELKLHPSAGSYISTNFKNHSTVHVKRIAKLEDFPKNHGGNINEPTNRFQSPTNKRYGKIKGRYS